ncbi:MAG: helix-turn-helix transcriptional regulator [Mycobacteriales bacterium]
MQRTEIAPAVPARRAGPRPPGDQPAPNQRLPARLWTHQETADFLGIPVATLHQLNYKGTAPRSFKVGRHRRYDPRDVWAWLSERASDRR